jgi:hypothetical protein
MPSTLTFYECKHCTTTGTCTNGEGQTACRACAKLNELPFWRQSGQVGLVCGCCRGLGQAEPLTDRLNKRMAPVLAVSLTFGVLTLILVTSIFNHQHFSEVLAFGGAIIGAVSGFYFSSKNNNI